MVFTLTYKAYSTNSGRYLHLSVLPVVLEIIPLSIALPVMANTILCVWAAHTSPEAEPPATAPPKAQAVQELSSCHVPATEAGHKLSMPHVVVRRAVFFYHLSYRNKYPLEIRKQYKKIRITVTF